MERMDCNFGVVLADWYNGMTKVSVSSPGVGRQAIHSALHNPYSEISDGSQPYCRNLPLRR